MLTKNLVDEINEKINIVDLVSEHVKLEKKGKNFVGLCPFHEDTNPSFSVSPERNIAKCFSCGVGGAPIKFYQEINHVTFEEAASKLAERLGIKISEDQKNHVLKEHEALKDASYFYNYYLNNSKSGEEILKYLAKRDIDKTIIEEFNIGFSPNEKDALSKILLEKGYTEEVLENAGLIQQGGKNYFDFFQNRITFPITDEKGNIVGFSGRSLTDKAKYVNSKDSFIFSKNKTLYNIYKALPFIKREKKVIIHEGYFDVIASFKAGVKNTVATMGTALTNEQINLITSLSNHVIIAYDGDNAGIEATLKAIKMLRGKRVKIDILPLDKLDPDDYLKKFGKEKYLQLFNKVVDEYHYQYHHYKSILNLNNMNEVSLLKEYVKEMLVGANKEVKEYYLNTLASDLGVSVTSLSNLRVESRKPIIPPKLVVRGEIPEKFYKSEINLFLMMITNIDWAKQIDHALGSEYVCSREVFKLRTILMIKYYNKHEKFDLAVFTSLLEEEIDKKELLETLDIVTKSLEYTVPIVFTDDDLIKHIDVLKKVNIEKEYLQTKKELAEELEPYRKTYLLEKLRLLKQKRLKSE